MRPIIGIQGLLREGPTKGKDQLYVIGGAFLHLALNGPDVLDYDTRVVQKLDRGHPSLSASRMSTVAKGAVGALKRAGKYEKRVFKFHLYSSCAG